MRTANILGSVFLFLLMCALTAWLFYDELAHGGNLKPLGLILPILGVLSASYQLYRAFRREHAL